VPGAPHLSVRGDGLESYAGREIICKLGSRERGFAFRIAAVFAAMLPTLFT